MIHDICVLIPLSISRAMPTAHTPVGNAYCFDILDVICYGEVWDGMRMTVVFGKFAKYDE